jgi:beta-lactamase regulating signal transducer with metallopeptidase domain
MDNFILYTLKSSLCLSAGYLLYYMLLRRETFHRIKRFIILGIIFISIIVPIIKLNVDPIGMNSPVQKLESTIINNAPVIISEQKPEQLLRQQQESKPINFLAIIYLAGASIQVILILISLRRILLLLLKAKKMKYQGIRLALTPSEEVPFCFGRRIIISEKDFRENSKEVILHEQTHLKEGHSLDLLISELYLVMTWYNPVSWLIRHELKQNHEFEADRNVLRQGVDESDYQLLLVRTVAGEPLYHLANQFNQSNIKTRITMMNKRKSNPRAILKALLFLPLIALMVQVFAQKEIKPAVLTPNDHPNGKYLVLTTDQLKLLGFDVNSTGLFYKNQRIDKPGRQTLCMYFTHKTYSASMILKPGEKITGHSATDQILKKQATTNFDFYPMVVAWINGWWTLLNIPKEDLPEDLLPVQINMADLKMLNRTDTLVFWFNPTESLRKTLAPIVRVDDYLQVCPPDARNDAMKGKQVK